MNPPRPLASRRVEGIRLESKYLRYLDFPFPTLPRGPGSFSCSSPRRARTSFWLQICGLGPFLAPSFDAFANLFCSPSLSWLNFLDFRDSISYEKDVENFNPDILFHIGALTSLEYCESNQDEAYETNTISVETATNIANKLDIPLLYILILTYW